MEEIGLSARFQSNGTVNREAFEMVESTPLAGLPRKDALERDLKLLLSEPEPTSVILLDMLLLDLDGFKAVNEKNGYLAGDECLEAAKGAAAACVTKKGKLYRFREGDEFAIILRNSAVHEAAATADRIRKSIETGHAGADLKVTASIGAASCSSDGFDTVEQL
jgi:diguanylate cyclase (GGDEF)-like protein